MDTLYLISVILHILAAMLWVGGNLFMIVVLIPAVKNYEDKAKVIKNVGLKFRTAGYVALGILLLTGLYQLHFRGVELTWASLTTHAIGKLGLWKIGLFLVIVALSGLHDYLVGNRAVKAWRENPQSPDAFRMRRQARLLGRINFLISLVLVVLGVLMVRGGV